VSDQEIVDRLAVLAKPHLTGLLRLRGTEHVYDPTPGALNSKVTMDGHTITLDKLKRASQPYRNIERFLSDEKIMQYIVAPGVLPLIKAISQDIMGKRMLVTRKLAPMDADKGVVGHLDGYGVRIRIYFDKSAGETIVEWSSLYGVR
jgi:hypothetical protein